MKSDAIQPLLIARAVILHNDLEMPAMAMVMQNKSRIVGEKKPCIIKAGIWVLTKKSKIHFLKN